MAGDQPMLCIAVTSLEPALGQQEFLLRFQQREPSDLFEISGETGLGGDDRKGGDLEP
jgi:hypothetical protein